MTLRVIEGRLRKLEAKRGLDNLSRLTDEELAAELTDTWGKLVDALGSPEAADAALAESGGPGIAAINSALADLGFGEV